MYYDRSAAMSDGPASKAQDSHLADWCRSQAERGGADSTATRNDRIAQLEAEATSPQCRLRWTSPHCALRRCDLLTARPAEQSRLTPGSAARNALIASWGPSFPQCPLSWTARWESVSRLWVRMVAIHGGQP